jgi:hypothetical protein
MAQIDWLAVVDILGQHVEQGAGAFPVSSVLLKSRGSVEAHPLILIRNGRRWIAGLKDRVKQLR